MQEVLSCNQTEGQWGFNGRYSGSEECFLEHGVLFMGGLLVPVCVWITKTSDSWREEQKYFAEKRGVLLRKYRDVTNCIILCSLHTRHGTRTSVLWVCDCVCLLTIHSVSFAATRYQYWRHAITKTDYPQNRGTTKVYESPPSCRQLHCQGNNITCCRTVRLYRGRIETLHSQVMNTPNMHRWAEGNSVKVSFRYRTAEDWTSNQKATEEGCPPLGPKAACGPPCCITQPAATFLYYLRTVKTAQ